MTDSEKGEDEEEYDNSEPEKAEAYETDRPWRIRHCTLASHLTCPNCYNIMNPHGLCDLPLLLNSLLHDTTLNLARMHFESQHHNMELIAVSFVILHQSLHFAGI